MIESAHDRLRVLPLFCPVHGVTSAEIHASTCGVRVTCSEKMCGYLAYGEVLYCPICPGVKLDNKERHAMCRKNTTHAFFLDGKSESWDKVKYVLPLDADKYVTNTLVRAALGKEKYPPKERIASYGERLWFFSLLCRVSTRMLSELWFS